MAKILKFCIFDLVFIKNIFKKQKKTIRKIYIIIKYNQNKKI